MDLSRYRTRSQLVVGHRPHDQTSVTVACNFAAPPSEMVVILDHESKITVTGFATQREVTKNVLGRRRGRYTDTLSNVPRLHIAENVLEAGGCWWDGENKA